MYERKELPKLWSIYDGGRRMWQITREEAMNHLYCMVTKCKRSGERWVDMVNVDALEMAYRALEEQDRKKGTFKKCVAVHKINGESRNAIVCSICGSGYFRYDTSENTESVMPNYCPNCGAKIEEER